MNTYTIANRDYTFISDNIADELASNLEKSYLCELNYLECLSVIGDKSRDFLQGQLSCDVRTVNENTYEKGALCNLQGRIKALIDIIYCHDFQLVLPADLIDLVKKDLRAAAMLSRVQLHQSENYKVLGITGNLQDPQLPEEYRLPAGKSFILKENFCCYAPGSNLAVLLMRNETAENLLQYYENMHQLRGSLLWHHHSLQNGFFSIYPSSSEHFLPHKVSLHTSGYLSFNKGCYKGQEIIARMHYRGKIKHELRFFTLHGATPPSISAALYHSDTHQEIGEILDFCPLNEDSYRIAASVLSEFGGQPLLTV